MIQVEPGVIKDSTGPSCRRVAGLARGGERRRRMVWVVRSLIIRLVTAIAIRRQGRVVVVHMATCARHAHVFSGQGENGLAVIERRRLPRCSRVTYVALLRETRRYVVGIGGSLEKGQMAAHASRAG